MRVPITINKEEYKKLKKLYKGTDNDVIFVILGKKQNKVEHLTNKKDI